MADMFVTRHEFNQFRHEIINNVTALQNSINEMQDNMAMFMNEIGDIRNTIINGFQDLNQRINNMNRH